MFEFVNHESFPEDDWVKELVVLRFEGKYNIGFVRRKDKFGMNWRSMSVGVNQEGKKKYFEAFTADSKAIEGAVKSFLEERSWERKSSKPAESDLPF